MESKKPKIVGFRKIRGRIVPIKKKETSYKPELIAGAAGIGTTQAAWSGTKRVIASEPEMAIAKFKNKYLSEIVKNKVSLKEMSGKNIAQFMKYEIDPGRTTLFGFKKINQIQVSKDMMRESTMLHELGHAISANKKFSMNKYMMKPFSPLSFPVIRRFSSLISEAEATAIAIKLAKKKGGFKAAARVSKSLSLPYVTYVGGAVASGALVS